MLQSLQLIWLIKIAIGLSFYVLIPGIVAAKWIVPSSARTLERFSLYFSLGYVLFSFVTFAGYLFESSFYMIQSAYQIFLLLFVVLKLRFINKRTRKAAARSGSSTFLLLVTICGIVISFLSGWYPRGDASVHLQAINNLITDGKILESRYSLPGHPALPDQQFNSLHVLISIICKTFYLESDVAWHYLSPFISVFVPSSLSLLLSAITKNERLRIYTITSFFVIAAIFPLIMHGTVFDALVYPNRFYLWIIAPTALYFVIEFINFGRKRDLSVVAACTATFLTVHLEGFIWITVFCAGMLVLVWPLWRVRGAPLRTAICLVTVQVVALPFLIWRMRNIGSFIEKASQHAWFLQYNIFVFSDYIYSFNPLNLGYYALPTIALLLFSVICYVRVRFYGSIARLRENQFILLTACSFLPFFLIYNPFIFPAAMDLVSAVVLNRMQRIPLYHFSLGFALLMAETLVSRSLGRSFGYRKVCSAIVLCAFALALYRLPAPTLHHEVLWSKELLSHLERENVVLADPITSSDVASMTPATVLNIQFNGPVELLELGEEKAAVEAFFSGDAIEAQQVVDQYEFSHVVATTGRQVDAVKSYEFLRPVKETSQGVLFEVLRSATAEEP